MLLCWPWWCLPLPSGLAVLVLWPLLSTLLLTLALFGEEEGSTEWSRLHSHSLAMGWPWKEEVEGVPCNTTYTTQSFNLAVSASFLQGHMECH